MRLTMPACGAILAFIISLIFILSPTPYMMVLFAFFAQPLFIIVGLLYFRRVFLELRGRDIL